MSKRILIGFNGKSFIRNCAENEGYNLGQIRCYGSKYTELHAVIIADDNIFEGI